MYYIYCYTNNITNRKYIGQTNNIERRKREHRSAANNKMNPSYNDIFHQKLREYGEENFSFSTLEEVENKETVDSREIYWIKEKKSFIRENGYNMTLGGCNPSINSQILTDEQVEELISEIEQGISYQVLANKYQISPSRISEINSGLYCRRDNKTYPLYKYYKTNDEYEELIDLLLNSDLTFKEISIQLNIGLSTIKKINYGTLRKGIYPDYPIRKITPQQRRANQIKELLLLGKTNDEILVEVDVSLETIKRINSGETHKDTSLEYPLR